MIKVSITAIKEEGLEWLRSYTIYLPYQDWTIIETLLNRFGRKIDDA